MNNKWDKEDIIVTAVIIVTAIIAIVVALSLGIRSKLVFYILIFVEIGIYTLMKKIMKK